MGLKILGQLKNPMTSSIAGSDTTIKKDLHYTPLIHTPRHLGVAR
jgi:hypothetical protein